MWRVGRSTGGFFLFELIFLFKQLFFRALQQFIVLFLLQQLQQLVFQLIEWFDGKDCTRAGAGFCSLQRTQRHA